MRLTFDITDADDATQAAEICDFIANSYAGTVSLSDTERPARTRRTRKAAVAQAFAETPKSDILADYNALATAAGVAPVATEVADPETETRADRDAAAAAQAELDRIAADAAAARAAADAAEAELAAVRTETAPVAAETRAEMQSKAKQVMLGLGFMWVRENVTAKYGRTLLNDFTDAEIAEIYAAAVAAQTKAHGA